MLMTNNKDQEGDSESLEYCLSFLLYRKVHSDGPPVIKLDRLYYPSFDFDIHKYGV